MADTKRGGRVLKFVVTGALMVSPLAVGCGDDEGHTINEPAPVEETINEPPEDTINEPPPHEEETVNEPVEEEPPVEAPSDDEPTADEAPPSE